MKRVLSIILALVMLVSSMSNILVFASDESTALETGDTVVLYAFLSDNPGVSELVLSFEYDSSAMNLVKVTNGEAMGDATYTGPKNLASGCMATWYYIDEPDYFKDGSLVALEFEIVDGEAMGDTYPLSVVIVSAEGANGTVFDLKNNIRVIDYRPGDVNGDGIHSLRYDVSEFNQYIVDGCKYDPLGYAVQINENAADVNNDGVITIKDVIDVNKYIVDGGVYDPNGYAVKLYPHIEVCKHTDLIAVPAREATCTEDGNKAYWICECGKYFDDETATTIIAFEDTIIPEKGHSYSSKWSYDADNHWHVAVCEHSAETKDLDAHTKVVVSGKTPTYDSTGLTDGLMCSVCNAVLVEQEVIEPLIPGEYSIKYELVYNADSYLTNNVDKIVNYNPDRIKENEELVLKDASVPGYNFEGWYDGTGTSANRVTKLAVGTNSDITLYARWSLSENSTYTVYFVSEGNACDVNYNGEVVSKITKPMNEQLIIPAPAMKGYVFLCWTDGDGNIVNSIEPGSYGEITLSAHWTSERNQARPVKKLGAPIIIEDSVEGKIHFIYELGDIINVPLEVIENFGNVDRLERESQTVDTQAITSTTAEKVSEVVAKFTSNSSSTTLSEDWNNSVSVSEEQNSDISQEDIGVISDRVENGGQWNISQSNGGSTEFSITSGESASSTHKSTTAAVHSSNMTLKKNQETGFSGEFNIGTSHKSSTESKHDVNVGLNVGYNPPAKTGGLGGGLDVGYNYTRTTYDEDSSHADLTLGSYNKNGSEIAVGGSSSVSSSTENSSESKTYTDLTNSNVNTWNTEEGYTKSRDDAHEETYTSAISTAIGEKLGYSTSSGTSGGESSTSSSVDQNEKTNEYVSTVEYSVENRNEKMTSSKVYKDYAGYHRLVEAGTVHVFGIVSYDISDGEFYTSTYSIVDTETAPFYDYSLDGTYTDRENGILPFEIPFFVNKYVTANMAYTEGLIIEPETGDVHEYIGDAKNVMLPNYYSVDEGDGTRSAVKVTKMLDDIFAGNENIETVLLSDYITAIPDGAFSGCTNLKTVIAPGVTTIGKNAFANCVNLDKFTVSEKVTSIGTDAFLNVPAIVVYASDAKVAKSTIVSGAIDISLYLEKMDDTLNNYTIQPKSNTRSFALYGAGKVLDEVNMVLSVDNVILNKATFTTTTGITLDIDAESLTLNQANASAGAVALLLRNPNTSISLERTSSFDSESGNSVVTNELSLTKTTSYAAYFKVEGNMLVNGDVDFVGNNLVTPEGCIIQINEDKYNAVIGKVNVSFESNGGTSINSQTIDYGTNVTEPKAPTKKAHSFLGWYTDEECTSEFDFSTPITSDITLYAKWKLNEFTLTLDPCEGSVSTTSMEVVYGEKYGTLPTPTRTGFTFKGWYTAKSHGSGTKVTADTVVTATSNHTIYAQWYTNEYSTNWSAPAGVTITVNRTSSPHRGAATGTISSGTAVYYGDVLSISYSVATGYTLATNGKTSITVTGNVTASDIYATASVNKYKVSWSVPTGVSISVKRTSSPLAGVTTGSLSSGNPVYHGDVLSITYSASAGYTLATKGKTSVTVTGNVTASDIYATATPNNYTYNVVYKSSNGTSLDSDTVTKAFNTTNTVSPKTFAGYDSPSSQSIKWDSTSAKTITFVYTPTAVPSMTISKSKVIRYVGQYASIEAVVEHQNRTKDSVQIRVNWTVIHNGPYDLTISHGIAGKVTIGSISNTTNITSYVSAGHVKDQRYSKSSDWITVPLDSTQASSISISVSTWQFNSNGTKLSGSDYTNYNDTWSVAVPAY